MIDEDGGDEHERDMVTNPILDMPERLANKLDDTPGKTWIMEFRGGGKAPADTVELMGYCLDSQGERVQVRTFDILQMLTLGLMIVKAEMPLPATTDDPVQCAMNREQVRQAVLLLCEVIVSVETKTGVPLNDPELTGEANETDQ